MPLRHATLDCQRPLCPLPVVRDRVAALQPGDTPTALSTDPGVLHDIPARCRINGHAVLTSETRDGEYWVTLQVAGGED